MKKQLYTLLILTLPIFASSQILWDDFEQNRISYYEFSNGGYTNRYPNPNILSSVNSSPLCAQYVRSPGDMWDVIVFLANGPIYDVTDYENGTKQMSIDIFSPAPGIPIQITLEDSTLADGPNYPFGRHSEYQAFTTSDSAWETLTFSHINSPDTNVGDNNVTSVVLGFNLGTLTNDTYYFDNLLGPEFNSQCDGLVSNPSVDFADWDCNWNLGFCPSASACASFDYMSGWLNHAYNPDTTSINTSKYSGSYTRNPDGNTGEDVLISYFTNGALDLSVNTYFNFKAYGPPRPIYMSFQDASNNEVLAFNSALLSNNQWQQFTVDLSSVASQSITRFVIFLDQGVVNWDVYFLDDFNVSSAPLDINNILDNDNIIIYPQPATNTLNVEINRNNKEINKLQLFDIKGCLLLSQSINQDNTSLDVSAFDSGIYFVKIQSDKTVFTQKIQITK